MNKLEIAKRAEKVLNDEVGYGYNETRARLYAVVTSPRGIITLAPRTSNGDVYELLSDRESVTALVQYDTVLVATCGWAAPVGDDNNTDLPPSLHPKRRRVRLACVLNDDGVASVLRFSDMPDETITDEGLGVGSLAEALDNLRKRARRNRRTIKKRK